MVSKTAAVLLEAGGRRSPAAGARPGVRCRSLCWRPDVRPRQRGRKYADGGYGSAERRAGRFAPRPGVLKMKFMNVTAFHISSPLLARAGRKNPSRPWAELLFSVFRP